jgi:hypothetical protein
VFSIKFADESFKNVEEFNNSFKSVSVIESIKLPEKSEVLTVGVILEVILEVILLDISID